MMGNRRSHFAPEVSAPRTSEMEDSGFRIADSGLDMMLARTVRSLDLNPHSALRMRVGDSFDGELTCDWDRARCSCTSG